MSEVSGGTGSSGTPTHGQTHHGGYPSKDVAPAALPVVDGQPGPGSYVDEMGGKAQETKTSRDDPGVMLDWPPRLDGLQQGDEVLDAQQTKAQEATTKPFFDGSLMAATATVSLDYTRSGRTMLLSNAATIAVQRLRNEAAKEGKTLREPVMLRIVAEAVVQDRS